MTNPDSPSPMSTCTFCGKTLVEVCQLVAASQPGVTICNECVMLAADLIIKDQEKLVRMNGEKNAELKRLRAENATLTAQLAGNTQQREEVKKDLVDKILSVLADEESATDSVTIDVEEEGAS
jgi:ATP-dependent protease Clp ATPase subunit